MIRAGKDVNGLKRWLWTALVWLCLSAQVQAETVQMILSESYPENHPVVRAEREFAQNVNERSGGRIQIELSCSGRLYLEEAAALEGVLHGDVALARVSATVCEKLVPEMEVFRLPYLFGSGEHYRRVMEGNIGEELLGAIGRSGGGAQALCWLDGGAQGWYTTRPLVNLGDLKNRRICTENPLLKEVLEHLGARTLTGIGPHSVYSTLAQGNAEGAEGTALDYYTRGDYDAAPYYYQDRHLQIPGVLLISDRALELLEEQDAAILLEEAGTLNRRAGELLEETMQAQRAAIEEAGGHFEEPAQEERSDTARSLMSGSSSGIGKIRDRQQTLVDRIETENNG